MMSSISAVFPMDTSATHPTVSVRQAYLNASAMAIFALVGYTVYHNLVLFSAFVNPLLWAVLVGFVLHHVKLLAVAQAEATLDAATAVAAEYPIPASLYLVALPLVRAARAADSLSAAVFDAVWGAGEVAASASPTVWAVGAVAVACGGACAADPALYWGVEAWVLRVAGLADALLHHLAAWSWTVVACVWGALLLCRYRVRVMLNEYYGDGVSTRDLLAVVLAVVDWIVCALTFTVFPAAPLYTSWGSFASTLSSLCTGCVVYVGYRASRTDASPSDDDSDGDVWTEPTTPAGEEADADAGESAAASGVDVAVVHSTSMADKAPEGPRVHRAPAPAPPRTSRRRRRRGRKTGRVRAPPHRSMWFQALYVLVGVVLVVRFPTFRVIGGVCASGLGVLVVGKVVFRAVVGSGASWAMARETVAHNSGVARVCAWASGAGSGVVRVSPAPVVEFARLGWRGVRAVDRAVVGVLAANANVLVTGMLIVAFFVVGTGAVSFLVFQIQAESMILFTKSQEVWSAAMASPWVERLWFASADVRDAVAMNDAFEAAYAKAWASGLHWVQEKLEALYGADVDMSLIESQVRAFWANYAGQAELGADGAPDAPDALDWTSPRALIARISDLGALSLLARIDLSKTQAFVAACLSSASQALTSLSVFFSFVVWLSFATIDFAVSLVVFLSALGYFLVSDTFRPLDILMAFAPTDELQASVKREIESTLKQVFLASTLLAWYHFLLVWGTFELVGAELVYIPAILSASMAVIPKFPSFLFVVPFAIEMWLVQGAPYAAFLGMFLPHLLAWWFVDTAIQASIQRSHPYLTGLAMVGGLSQWGLQGAILGPLLVSMLTIAASLLTSAGSDSNDFLTSFIDPASPSPPPSPAVANRRLAALRSDPRPAAPLTFADLDPQPS